MYRFSSRIMPPALAAGLLALVSCAEEPVLQSLPLDPASTLVELRISSDSVLLRWLGAKTQLKAQLRNAKGDLVDPPRIYWQSTNSNVATVDSTGTVEGVGLGKAQVVASFLELADTVSVTVVRIPVKMAISVDTLLFTELGRTADVGVTVWDGADRPIADAKVTWSSTAYAIAFVDDRGRVSAMGNGLATVSARVDTLVRSTRVRVATRATTMSVTPTQLRLDGISDTARVVTVVRNAAGVAMHPPQPTYVSSDTTVAKVDFIGFVIARKAGSSTITVTADTLRATVPVTVTQAVAAVRVVPDTATVAVGSTKAYASLVKDRFGFAVAGAAVTWSSSDTIVAKVSSAGVVTGMAPGTATILAASGIRSDTALVTVRAASPAPPPGSR